MRVLKVLFVFVLFFGIMFSVAPRVSADIAFPECRWNEISVSCNCPHANDVCADNTCSACLTYKNDARYYFLWNDIYCRKATLLELLAKFEYPLIIPFITMILIDAIVFYVRGYKKLREIGSVLLTNCVSFFVGIILLGIVPKSITGLVTFFKIPSFPVTLFGMDIPRMVSLLVIAALMTVGETLILVYVFRFTDRKKVFITAITANFASLILGIGTLNAVYPRFLQPRLF